MGDDLDTLVARLRALSRDEAHRVYRKLHRSDPSRAAVLMDRYPELHARLAAPPRRERVRGAVSVAYRRQGGQWAAESIEVRGRRHARRAGRVHPSATVTVSASLIPRILARAPRARRQRQAARRAGGARTGQDPGDEGESSEPAGGRLPELIDRGGAR